MKRVPSRLLNERPGIMGLSVIDIGIIGYSLIFSHSLLSQFGLELLSFPFAGILTIGLVGIRIKHRPKIIRDYILFHFSKRIYFKSLEGL